MIRLRVAERTKTEWREHARERGIGLSDFVRLACQLSALIGHDRLADGLSEITSMRRDLHALSAELRRLVQDKPNIASDEVRTTLARVHSAAEAVSTIIRGGSK